MYCFLAFFIWLLFKGSKSFLFRIYVLTKLCTPCIVCWYFFSHPTVIFCSKDIIAHSEYIIKSSQNHRYYLDIWSRTCCIVCVNKFRWTNLEFTYHVQLMQKNGPGAPGGQSWTAEWLKFDNSYFKVCVFCHILHTAKFNLSLSYLIC